MTAGTIQQLAPTDRGRAWIVFEVLGILVALFALLIVGLSAFDRPSETVSPSDLPAGTPYVVYETSAGLHASIDCPSLWQVVKGEGDPVCRQATRRSTIALVVSSIFVLGGSVGAVGAHRERHRVRDRTMAAPPATWSFVQRARPLGVDFVVFLLVTSGFGIAVLRWQPDGLLATYPLLFIVVAALFWRATWRQPESRATEMWLSDAYTLDWTTPEGAHRVDVGALRRVVVRRRRRPRPGPRVRASFELADGTAIETIAVDEGELRGLLSFVATLIRLEPELIIDVGGGGTRRWPAPEPGLHRRRPIAQDEAALVSAMLGTHLPERDVLVDQMDGLTVRELDDDGSLELRVRSDAPQVDSARLLLSEATTGDADGVVVDVLLLVVAGRLHHLDVHRDDGQPLQVPIDPAGIELGASSWSG